MPALTWRSTIPTAYAIGANQADDFLVAINSMVTGNSGSADAYWEVANYSSASPKSVLLKRKDGSPGRIIFFGQQGGAPNAAAIYPSAGSSRLIVAYSKTSTSNTPDASFLTAAPLSATDYMRGIGAMLTDTNRTYRMYYIESSAGFILVALHFVQVFNSTTTQQCCYAMAGDLFAHKGGTNCPMLMSQGNGTAASWTAPETNAFISATITTTYSGGLICLVQFGGNIERAFRFDLPALAANMNDLRDDTESRMAFLPIRMTFQLWNPINSGLAGKLRQIAYGPQALQEAFIKDSSTDMVVAAGITPGVTALNDTMWITNVEV
jgi:hypothetical protein